MVMMMILVRGEHGRTWGSPGCGFYHDLRGDRTRTETRTLRCMVFSKCQTLNLNYLCVCVCTLEALGDVHTSVRYRVVLDPPRDALNTVKTVSKVNRHLKSVVRRAARPARARAPPAAPRARALLTYL